MDKKSIAVSETAGAVVIYCAAVFLLLRTVRIAELLGSLIVR